MEMLTQHQFHVLKLLANGDVKNYCNVSGIARDGKGVDQHNQEFNDLLRLVELELLEDISSQCIESVLEYHTKTGGDVAIVRISPLGQLMFERHRHTKWKN